MHSQSTIPNVSGTFPGPKAQAILTKFDKYKSPSLSQHPPLVWKKAENALVEDVDGNLFIDLSSGIAVTNTGHSNPLVVNAIRNQAINLLNCYDHPTAERADLQEMIAYLAGTDLKEDVNNRVHLVSAGSEAIEFVVKLSRRYKKKYEIITTHGAFHGRGSIQAMALTDDIKYRKGYGVMPPGVLHVPYAYCYRCPYDEKFPDCDLLCAKQFERVFQYESCGDICAFFVEPIQGASGYIVPPDEYIQSIKHFCEKYEILMVDDEIQAGFGRTGKLFSIEHTGVKPDVMVVGKALGGGLPVGAVAAREGIINSMSSGDHSTTFGGNPLSCAAALANINSFDDNLLSNVSSLGKHIMDRLNEMKASYKMIGDVRGRGLMIGVELVKDRKSKTPASIEMRSIREELYKNGVIMVTAGIYSSVLRIAPPLTIEKKLVDSSLDIFEKVLSKVEKKMT